VKKILFVTYGGGHADIVLRLLPYIEANPGLEYSILALTTAGTFFDKHGISYKRCIDYLPLSGYEEALDVGGSLSKALWDSSSGIPYIDSCAYLGVSMLDLIAEDGAVVAKSAYKKLGRKSFCPTGFMQNVIQAEEPDVVITTCYVRMERAAIIAAKSLGIKSILIEDLFGYSLLGEKPLEVNELVFPLETHPDHIFVLNEFVRERHIQAGLPVETIHVTGQPVLSEWVEDYESALPEVTLEKIRQEGYPVITYIAPAARRILYEQTDAIIELAKLRPDWRFCIKLHPSIGVREFTKKYPDKPETVKVMHDEEILSVVKGSDLILIFSSTVGLLCVFCNVPLLVLDCLDEPSSMPYVSSGVARGINNYHELEAAVQAELDGVGNDTDVKTDAGIFYNPPRAAEKIISVLYKLL